MKPFYHIYLFFSSKNVSFGYSLRPNYIRHYSLICEIYYCVTRKAVSSRRNRSGIHIMYPVRIFCNGMVSVTV